MTLTVNWATKVIDSSASITDLPAFHAELRTLEDDATGAIYPVTHSWKALDLGGAFFYGLELLNGYQLRFPTPGNYTITGNLGGSVVPVAGVYVERKTSAAYITTAVGGSGPSASDIAAALLAALNATTGARTLGQHLQIQTAVLAGETSGSGTTHITFSDGTVSVEADVPAAGQTGDRKNVVIDGV